MMEQRCKHDMLPGQCAQCLGHKAPGEETIRNDVTVYGGIFQAAYPGRCQRCERGIHVDVDSIQRAEFEGVKGYVHWRCPS